MAGVLPLSHESAPEPAQRVLIACTLAAADEPRIRHGVRGEAEVRFVPRVADLLPLVARERERILAVLVPTRDRFGCGGVQLVREIVRQYPDVPVVGHCRAGIEHSADLRDLALAGVHEFLFAGVDDAGIALRTVLEAAARECAGELVLQQVLPLVPQRLHLLVEKCLLHPQAATSVAAVADMLGVTRKTLFNYCSRESFPPPAEVIAWCRLLLVAYLLERTSRTVQSIALELEFASDTALRNMIKRYTGRTATDIRRAGGLRHVLATFAERRRPAAAAPEPVLPVV